MFRSAVSDEQKVPSVRSFPQVKRGRALNSGGDCCDMRVAVIHEWFDSFLAGSEQVVEQILGLYKDANVFSLVDFMPQEEREFLNNRSVKTSFIQRLPLAKQKFRAYLPLFPLAIEQFDLTGYDLIISSSHAVAKGVITGPDQLHICYCHSPIRYAWDLREEYLRERNIDTGWRSLLARIVLHKIRIWDVVSAASPDYFLANSEFVRARIQKFYRRPATVIYPPVDVHRFRPSGDKDDFYLTVSRSVPYKRVPVIVDAFRQTPRRRLVVIGDGPDAAKVRAAAAGAPNIEMLGFQPCDVVADHMRRARAFIFAAREDFGIVPVEAQACGTPVIAYGDGGVVESVRGLGYADRPTGVFFEQQTSDAIIAAVDRFERNLDAFSAEQCRANALRFSRERFRTEIAEFINRSLERHWHERRPLRRTPPAAATSA
jgi:glycosyltransferase involved in cell wall biosynthesis